MFNYFVKLFGAAASTYSTMQGETCDVTPIGTLSIKDRILQDYVKLLVYVSMGYNPNDKNIKQTLSVNLDGTFNKLPSILASLKNPYPNNRNYKFKYGCYVIDQSGIKKYRVDSADGPYFFRENEKILEVPPFNPFIPRDSDINDILRKNTGSSNYIDNLPNWLVRAEHNGINYLNPYPELKVYPYNIYDLDYFGNSNEQKMNKPDGNKTLSLDSDSLLHLKKYSGNIPKMGKTLTNENKGNNILLIISIVISFFLLIKK